MRGKGNSCTRCPPHNTSYFKSSSSHHSNKHFKLTEKQLNKKIDELYREGEKWKQSRSKAKKQEEEKLQAKQMGECTFKPAINASNELYVSNDPFLKRQIDWKLSIQKKLKSQRQQKQARQKQSYTFQPKISAPPNLTHSLISNKKPETPMKTQTSLNYTIYSKHPKQKNSYKLIHAHHQKFKDIVNKTTVEPFRHRKMREHQTQITSKTKDNPQVNMKASMQWSEFGRNLQQLNQQSTDKQNKHLQIKQCSSPFEQSKEESSNKVLFDENESEHKND